MNHRQSNVIRQLNECGQHVGSGRVVGSRWLPNFENKATATEMVRLRIARCDQVYCGVRVGWVWCGYRYGYGVGVV